MDLDTKPELIYPPLVDNGLQATLFTCLFSSVPGLGCCCSRFERLYSSVSVFVLLTLFCLFFPFVAPVFCMCVCVCRSLRIACLLLAVDSRPQMSRTWDMLSYVSFSSLRPSR
jgi:hypothetical protein